MPRKTIDYNNTQFYKIVCKDLTVKECYIGHTTNFSTRKSVHKHNTNNAEAKDHNMHVYQFIVANGGWENFDMILIETKSCNGKIEACKFEREFIEQLNATLNSNRPIVTRAEKKEHCRLYALSHSKTYYQSHRAQILKQKQEYYIRKKHESFSSAEVESTTD